MSSVEWFYAKDGGQVGPVTTVKIRQLAAAGKLAQEDLVWREGMDQWQPARHVKGLFGSSPALGGTLSVRDSAELGPVVISTGGGAEAEEGEEEQPPRHVFDVFLDFARRRFTGRFVSSATALFAGCGHYTLYLAMLVLFALSVVLTIETHSATMILPGIAGVLILAVLQYTARRFCDALQRLNRAAPAAVSSTAFLDCYALLSMIAGVAWLLVMSFLAVETEEFGAKDFGWILQGVAGFAVFAFMAVVSLNPATLALRIDTDAGAGEEAIGVISFLVKVAVRLVPVAFGAGVVLGTFELLRALVLVFQSPEVFKTLESSLQAGRGGTVELAGAPATVAAAVIGLILAAALPFLSYVAFLCFHLFVEVIRALLTLGRR
ncbi:MAG: DUF4339 domain-containing protein [Planctomycetes bacterium]|nr:DUF4339 domain-containing protein [Planctomycetota bacterium]